MSSVKLEGDIRKLQKRFGKLSALDIKAKNRVLAETIRSSTLERFNAEKSPDEKKWQKSIRAAAEGGKTLQDSRDLRGSIRSKITGSGFAVGTNKVNGPTHQYGEKGRTIRAKTSKGLRFRVGGVWINKKSVTIRIPARPFMGISEEDLKEIKSTMEQMLMED